MGSFSRICLWYPNWEVKTAKRSFALYSYWQGVGRSTAATLTWTRLRCAIPPRLVPPSSLEAVMRRANVGHILATKDRIVVVSITQGLVSD